MFCVHGGGRAQHTHKDHQRTCGSWNFFSYHVSPRDQTQVSKLDSRWLLRHTPAPPYPTTWIFKMWVLGIELWSSQHPPSYLQFIQHMDAAFSSHPCFMLHGSLVFTSFIFKLLSIFGRDRKKVSSPLPICAPRTAPSLYFSSRSREGEGAFHSYKCIYLHWLSGPGFQIATFLMEIYQVLTLLQENKTPPCKVVVQFHTW